MIKNYLIYSLLLLGTILIVLGLTASNFYYVIFGSVSMFLAYFFFVEREKRSSIFFYKESYEKLSKERPVSKIKIKFIIISVLAVLIFIIVWIILARPFSGKSFLNLQAAISEGCSQLDPKTGCKKDPSEIIVPYDVNENGITGDSEDTLYSILQKEGCFEECIKQRCGCI